MNNTRMRRNSRKVSRSCLKPSRMMMRAPAGRAWLALSLMHNNGTVNAAHHNATEMNDADNASPAPAKPNHAGCVTNSTLSVNSKPPPM